MWIASSERIRRKTRTAESIQHKEISVSTTVVATETVALQISREEAEMIVDGLHMLLNSRRFAFKEPNDDVRQLHARVYEAVERIEAEIKKGLAQGKSA